MIWAQNYTIKLSFILSSFIEVLERCLYRNLFLGYTKGTNQDSGLYEKYSIKRGSRGVARAAKSLRWSV